ncbi:MAG: AmmeMemoRadiSam system protein A [Thermanaeromonas sp.]|uniref:AmmeMemoRadiSam system protein A n=1 Tax=Thermanaeromonas sp. TaxID=2003697 RepID=UPI00243B72F1|nr:AmmeMemoRadiSam system protein A [Thermanaeromonas sp.]MCG0277152.1 AmmeMemoRadiSam system protein A [Thermanaeromonas sp.]
MGRLLEVIFLPHPPIMVPEVGGEELTKIASTVASAREVAREAAKFAPDVVVIISPHGPVFRDAVGLWATYELKGSLAAFRAPQVKFRYILDQELTREIAAAASQEGIQVVLLDENNSRRYGLVPELDHGMMVPLYFLREAGVEGPLVAMGMAFMPREKLYAFGAALARAIKSSSRRAILIASGDLSHRLTPEAPAGYDPQGEIFDGRLKDLIAAFDVTGILNLPEELAERAGECGLRSFIMGLGALDGYRVEGGVFSYEGPFGVGYLVARFLVREEDPDRSLLKKKPEQKEAELSFPVRLAKESLEHYLHTGRILPVPKDLPPEMERRAGVFVSIKKFGQLRGCIGTVSPVRSNIAEEIIYNALSAGLEDPRFPPVTVEELPYLEYSVDVLEEPEPVSSLEELDPRVYGVIVSSGRKKGLLLPDLEGIDTPEEQVAIAKRKAGIGPNEPCRLQRFRVTRYR